MNYVDRLVTQTPLTELWNAQGPVQAKRGRFLNPEEIKSILRTGPVRFVVVDIGGHLRWISSDDCFEFWKTVKPNIAKEDRFFLEDYPGEFAYVATEWKCESGEAIILLEMSH